MAKKKKPTTTSGAAAFQKKLGAKVTKAVKENRSTEVEMGSTDVPGDVAGTAQLTGVFFREIQKEGDNKGVFMAILEGTAISPKANEDGVRVEGKRTQRVVMMKPQGDKTIDDKIAEFMNEVKKMGIDISGCKDMVEIETLCKQVIAEEDVIFEFATKTNTYTDKQGKERTAINTYFNGVVDSELVDEEEDDVEVEDEEQEEELEDEEEEVNEEEQEEEESEEEQEEDYDLDSLLENANNDDEEAQAELLRIAEELGVEGAEELDEWSDVVEAIQNVEPSEDDEEEEEGEDEEEGDWTPEEGEEYHYFTTKRIKKSKACSVIAVDEENQTVNLTHEESGKEYNDVPWSDLLEEETTR